MQVSEFDRFADEYLGLHQQNIRITGESPEYFSEYKIKTLRARAGRFDRLPAVLLDFGSGIGSSIPWFKTYFPGSALICADVSQRSLALGESRFPGHGRDVLIDNARIPLDDASCDLAFSACVFHHIDHAEHDSWLRELRRVVRPGGVLAIFEHNPLNPLTVRAVNTCPFDVNARLIQGPTLARRCRDAGWAQTTLRYHLFFPRLLAALRPLEPLLGRIPFGGQYSVLAR